jgi:hypothetical protein
MEMNADPKGKPRQTDRILATRRGDTKRKHSTTPLRTRFRHLTLFPLNNPLHLLQIMTESARRRMANVRFGSEADIEARPFDVRFTPKSGHC